MGALIGRIIRNGFCKHLTQLNDVSSEFIYKNGKWLHLLACKLLCLVRESWSVYAMANVCFNPLFRHSFGKITFVCNSLQNIHDA